MCFPDAPEAPEWPILSKDSKQLAYPWISDGVYSVWVSPAEPGAKPRVVLRNPEFGYYFLQDWAPDGKSILATIVMAGNTAQLAWISVADGTVTTLKSFEWGTYGAAHLSPDGRFIAYDAQATQGAPDHEIRIIAADASRESVVVAAPVTSACRPPSQRHARPGRRRFRGLCPTARPRPTSPRRSPPIPDPRADGRFRGKNLRRAPESSREPSSIRAVGGGMGPIRGLPFTCAPR